MKIEGDSWVKIYHYDVLYISVSRDVMDYIYFFNGWLY